MAYQFETTEPVAESFCRCAREEIDRALSELTDGVKVAPVTAVHEARKALKMERSLLRLGRGALGRRPRGRANAQLRDAARRLSGARDADVMLDALGALAERYAGQVPESTFAALRERLEQERARTRAEVAGSGELAAATDELRAVRAGMDGWRLRAGGWSAIEPGLERSYRRGRAAFALARRDPSVENLHSFRKRAKDLWYHLRLLGPSAPVTLQGHIKEAHGLADLLGDDHDLAVLHETVLRLGPGLAADLGPVVGLIEHRRAQLQREARRAGERLYAEKPRAFTRRLHRYWQAGRREARSTGHPAELAGLASHAPTV